QPRHHHRVALGLAVVESQCLGSRCLVEPPRRKMLLHLCPRAAQVAPHRIARYPQLARLCLTPQPNCASCAICLTTSAATIGTSTSRRCTAPDQSIHELPP